MTTPSLRPEARAKLPRMSGITPIGALRIVDHVAWKARVLRTLKECGGRVPETAEELGVSSRTLFRWLVDLDAEVPKKDGGKVPRAKQGPRGPRNPTKEA